MDYVLNTASRKNTNEINISLRAVSSYRQLGMEMDRGRGRGVLRETMFPSVWMWSVACCPHLSGRSGRIISTLVKSISTRGNFWRGSDLAVASKMYGRTVIELRTAQKNAVSYSSFISENAYLSYHLKIFNHRIRFTRSVVTWKDQLVAEHYNTR
jgi:hypothetical protein